MDCVIVVCTLLRLLSVRHAGVLDAERSAPLHSSAEHCKLVPTNQAYGTEQTFKLDTAGKVQLDFAGKGLSLADAGYLVSSLSNLYVLAFRADSRLTGYLLPSICDIGKEGYFGKEGYLLCSRDSVLCNVAGPPERPPGGPGQELLGSCSGPLPLVCRKCPCIELTKSHTSPNKLAFATLHMPVSSRMRSRWIMIMSGDLHTGVVTRLRAPSTTLRAVR